MAMRSFLVLLSVTFISILPVAVEASDTVKVANCLLALDAEATVPAQEPGVLTKIPVHEGQQVAVGDLLAQIDDAIPRMQREVADYKLEVAKKQAADDVDIRFATAAADVAEAEYHLAVEANKKVPGTVPQARVRELLLEHRKMSLSIEKAQKDRAVAALQANVAEAELRAADVNLKHRRITAPLDAVVVELSKHEGEWAQSGDPIMRLVRIDRLRVEGFLNAKNFRLSEIRGCPVSVTVELARGKKETFPGRIVYVKPLVEAGGEFLVRAEVENRKENEVWLLSPGMSAEMTIQLK
jgi:multidrug efflux pump subunit AcrA (membrane-fusion protein)